MTTVFTVFLSVLLPLVVYGAHHTGHDWTTQINVYFDFTCNSKQGLFAFNGNNYNHEHRDRTYNFKCKDIARETDNNCYTTDYLNDYDRRVDFQCKHGEFIGGIISDHNNDKEDRIWKVKCCKNPEVSLFHCEKSHYANSWREWFRFELTDATEDRFITGIESDHWDNQEDRKWKFYTCRAKVRPQSTVCNDKKGISKFRGSFSGVAVDRKWNFECSGHDIVNGDTYCYWSAMANYFDLPLYYRCRSDFYLNAIESYGSNYFHDRIYNFRCCTGPDFETYGCKETPTYINNFKDNIDFSTNGGILLGLESYHDSTKEDRRWRLETCEYGRHIIHMECPSGHGIYKVRSQYIHDRSDRSWTYECRKVVKSSFDYCFWTDYMDYTNGYLNAECDVVTGVRSLFNVRQQRRVMKVRCCSSKNLVLGECTKTNDVNGLKGDINYEVSSNAIVTGLESFYNNDQKDAAWKVSSCLFMERPELSFDCQDNSALSYMRSAFFKNHNDRFWTFSCVKVTETGFEDCKWLSDTYLNDFDGKLKAECPKNYVITAGKSTFSTGHRDRRWNFKCCKPKDNSVIVDKCVTTPYINFYQQNLEIALSENRVITGLESYHHNYYEDRRWRATICQYKCCSTKL